MFTYFDVSFFKIQSLFPTHTTFLKKELSVLLPIVDSLDFSTPMLVPKKPILVYMRRHEIDVHPSSSSVGTADPPPSSSVSLSDNFVDELLIALRKGKHICTTHPITQFVSTNLTLQFQAFTSFLDSITLPYSIQEALQHPSWISAMNKELHALLYNDI